MKRGLSRKGGKHWKSCGGSATNSKTKGQCEKKVLNEATVNIAEFDLGRS